MRRRIVLGLIVLWSCLLPGFTAATEIRQADSVWQGEDRLLVRLYLDMELPDVLLQALENGIGIHFLSEVNLEYRRGIFGERAVATASRRARLEYYALSRHYVITDRVSRRVDFAPTLGDALEILARRLGRIALEVGSAELRPGVDYQIAARVQLDHGALPLPLQWETRLRGAYVTQPGWYRWSLD
ncbi:hypothetical protein TVNIR_0420 [Thioalkalivibrio nitratireducens DSM 14787]|uniref:Proline rich signal peptide protein n=1 Tax=Thioalkalivibrio nitratireducens (strain DSM 14787 / UNIQEM 213 / ALEN2) TaxID=1255043 RepID=L0DT10_THIND|nr:DUF4390 domain-containing protein [Thioalkalivibrio nitratireducens]AGA32125.1 hypothetical protein TVNIR_0420 [Thioalkalivibrio nitratireducens DSM 14787]